MNRATSLYLDLVRFCAAASVMVGHLAGTRFTGGFLWQLAPLMEEAVAVFFVLSGFVIAYTTEARETSAPSYIVARTAHICSVAIPALVATFALDALGRAFAPGEYSATWGYVADGRVWQALSGLTFTNEIRFARVSVGSMLPYWSLGYEVWYYVLFGVAIFAPRRWRAPGIAAVLLLVGPRIAVMFPLWLLGVGAYRLTRSRRPGPVLSATLCVGSLMAWAVYEFAAAHPVGFDGVGTVVARPLERWARPIRWAAGATFSLYLMPGVRTL
jgi:peptidoglycan/LPS O-acetylase OafA/YrhL